MFRLRHELDAILLPFRCLVQTRLLYASFNVEHGLSRGFLISLHRNVYIFGKIWHIDTRNLYIRKWHICRKNTFFELFPLKTTYTWKIGLYTCQESFYLKRFMYSSHTQKHVVQLGMNSFFSKMCQGHDISQHLLPMLNFLFTRMPTGNAYRFKYDNPILFCNVWSGWL